MKRILSIALAFAMLLSFAVIASAEGSQPCTITIENATPGYTYYAYQIFSGDVGTLEGKTVLTNIDWGSGVNATADGFKDAVQTALGVTPDAKKGETFTADFVASNLNENNAAAFAKAIAKTEYLKSGTLISYDEDGKVYEATVSSGYYLIQNTAVPSDGATNTAFSAYILKVTDNVAAKPKTGVPTIEKKVYDTQDDVAYSGIHMGWKDSADHDIGDTVQYKVTLTIPGGTLQHYDTYNLTITDTLSKGLTYTYNAETEGLNLSQKDEVGANKIYTYTLAQDGRTVEPLDDGTKITLQLGDVKAFASEKSLDMTKDIKIDWYYDCTLNENAVIGSAGNPNDVTLTYSNNPNDSKGTGTTPKDTAIVFTYQVNVNKVDQDGEPLTGAEFTLYKGVIYKVDGAKTLEEIKSESNSKFDIDEWDMACNYYIEVGKSVGVKSVNQDGTVFSFKGLDDGSYILVETKVPDGYNGWAAKLFFIVANHEAEGNPAKLTSFAGGTGDHETSKDTGTITMTIKNKSGATLPSTGGMGTTIFYIVGTTLALGAAILLIAKKRVSR